LIGAFFFVLVQEQLALTLEAGHQIIFGILFIIVVLVFPGGLAEAGGWVRRRLKRETRGVKRKT
jgi:ABC-type branched-subunit amino acid transport system permease subunit